MYAIVKVGSSQYKVAEGDLIEVHRIKDEDGKAITLDKVLMFAKGADIRIGQPYLSDVKISAKVIKKTLGKKVTAFKYRKRKDSSSKVSHRTKFTAINITKIAA